MPARGNRPPHQKRLWVHSHGRRATNLVDGFKLYILINFEYHLDY
jgi:hypothetical protein